jgi:Mn-dependent DtxR family transcriptional regulator
MYVYSDTLPEPAQGLPKKRTKKGEVSPLGWRIIRLLEEKDGDGLGVSTMAVHLEVDKRQVSHALIRAVSHGYVVCVGYGRYAWTRKVVPAVQEREPVMPVLKSRWAVVQEQLARARAEGLVG